MKFTADSKILIQGITEPLGRTYTPLMQSYGTQIVAGVSPGHGGDRLHDVPIFDLVEQAVTDLGPIDTSVICCSPYQALDSALEAIAADIHQLILLSEGIPPLDMVHLIRKAEATETLLIGPNSCGLIVPGEILLGTHPSECYTPGPVGIISRSSTLTFEVAHALTQAGIGQSISIGIGSDTIVGSTFPQWLQTLDEDDKTEAIVLIGEIGGNSEEQAAQYIQDTIDKPIIAYVAGRHAPKGEYMGHVGAIIASQAIANGALISEDLELGTAEAKIAAFEAAKIAVAQHPAEVPALVQKKLKGKKS